MEHVADGAVADPAGLGAGLALEQHGGGWQPGVLVAVVGGNQRDLPGWLLEAGDDGRQYLGKFGGDTY